jgi:hypothetical protein
LRNTSISSHIGRIATSVGLFEMSDTSIPNAPTSKPPSSRPSFAEFYREHFRAEHQHPANVSLHVLGVLASTVWLVWTINSPLPWLALAYPVVHAAPGLAGHRLFERNPAVGDVRVLRRDFPMAWFVLGNHVLVLDLMLRGLRRIQRTLRG